MNSFTQGGKAYKPVGDIPSPKNNDIPPDLSRSSSIRGHDRLNLLQKCTLGTKELDETPGGFELSPTQKLYVNLSGGNLAIEYGYMVLTIHRHLTWMNQNLVVDRMSTAADTKREKIKIYRETFQLQ